MGNKFLNTLLAGAAVATMGAFTAQASVLDSIRGPVKIQFDGFTELQTYQASCGGFGFDVAGGVADCNTLAAVNGAVTNGSLANEDIWGFALINLIEADNLAKTQLYDLDDAANDNEFLIAYFHGFEDFGAIVTPGFNGSSVDSLAVGGSVDFYRLSDRSIYDTFLTAGPNGRSDFTTALQTEELFLGLDFVPGCIGGVYEEVATLCRNGGNLSGDAVVTSGTAQTIFPNIFQFEQSIAPCDENTVTGNCKDGVDFSVKISTGSARTIALPEPGALGLLGLGLVGLGMVGRRRKVV